MANARRRGFVAERRGATVNTHMQRVSRDLTRHGIDDPRGIGLGSSVELEAKKVF